jgi:pimeloyl-ACP methyl ester carboxylesterase
VSKTHNTARTQFAAANGVRYAYRQFGSGNRPPLLCLQHFRGGLDNWDPSVTDGLTVGASVIREAFGPCKALPKYPPPRLNIFVASSLV